MLESVINVINEYGEKFAEAKAAYTVKRDEAQAQKSTLRAYESERGQLVARLESFDAGHGGFTADEYQAAADRARWLAGSIKAQSKIAEGAERSAVSAAQIMTGYHSAARAKVAELIRAEHDRQLEEAGRRLEEVLR